MNSLAAFSFVSQAVRCNGSDLNYHRLTFFTLTSAVAVIAWVRNVEAEHAEHEEHIRKENDGHLPEVPAYDYLNRRVKPYPWGPNSLFFNPHVRPSCDIRDQSTDA